MTSIMETNELLTSAETAKLLGLKANTLAIYRLGGKGPPFLKLGPSKQSAVRYERKAVMEWLEQNTYTSTSAYSPAAGSGNKTPISGTGGAL